MDDEQGLTIILDLQKQAFEPLYLKYKDEKTSPYKDKLSDISRKFLYEPQLLFLHSNR